MCRTEELQLQQQHAGSRKCHKKKKNKLESKIHTKYPLQSISRLFFLRIYSAFTSPHAGKAMCHVLPYGCHWLAAHRPANLKCKSNEMTTHIACFIEIYYPLGCIKTLMFLIASQLCFFVAGILLLLRILLGIAWLLGGPTNRMLAL